MTAKVALLRLRREAEELPLPSYATEDAAGMDLRACLGSAGPMTIRPGERVSVPTGLALALPHGTEAQVRPRSGLALKHGVTVLNSPGTIDADYRGEIGIILINLGETAFRVERGMRIAQLVVAPVNTVIWQEKETLPATDRADGGFGSTGLQGGT